MRRGAKGLRSLVRGVLLRVQIALQNEDGGDLVDDGFAGVGRAACGIQMAMRLGGAEAFIPEKHGEFQLRFDLRGKLFCGKGARADIAGHVQGQANDNGGAAVAPDDAGKRTHVIAAIGAVDSEQRLGGVAKLIGQSNADAAIPMIEAQDAGRCGRIRLA